MIRNAFVLCIVCAVIVAFFLPSYFQMQSLHEKNVSYERKIKELTDDNVKLNAEKHRLVDDPEYFEKVARERLGIIKDGEVVYKIVPAGSKKGIAQNASDGESLLRKPDSGDQVKVTDKVSGKSGTKKADKAPVSKKSTAKKPVTKVKVTADDFSVPLDQ
ncbi:MAG: septum formation initiator family protein [Candidatus Omnitrophica bacterium]|nr:septum formation initiator family protein [Candidatus Omnitrophota bacterium]